MTTAVSIDVSLVPEPHLAREHWRAFKRVLTHTHTYSGRSDHGGTMRPPESYRRLAQWAERCGIDAVGMGSPYTPGTVQAGRRAGVRGLWNGNTTSGVDRVLRGDDEIARMLEAVNDVARGQTLFYLDNETPKGRFGHLWWVGYQLDYPAWHDYDDAFDQWMCHQVEPGDDSDEPMPYTRRPYGQIVAQQRRAGALAFWAHPTSWWRDDHGRFITNIASEMPAHAIADGRLDGMVVMGYRSWRPEYMDLWIKLLDAGFRVTGVAEEDIGLSDSAQWERTRVMANLVHLPGDDVTVPALVRGFAAGRVTASSGSMLDMTVDKQPMGAAVTTSADRGHRVCIHLDPHGSTGRLELIGHGGAVVWHDTIDRPVRVRLTVPGRAARGYLLARYVAHEGGRHRSAAVGNPVYLHPRGDGFEPPAETKLHLTLASTSPFRGGRIRFEQADGQVIGSAALTTHTITETLPAGGRFTLTAPDGREQTEYLINANPQLNTLQRELYRGRFLRHFPSLMPGEVPPAAWRLDAFAAAMRELALER